MRVLVVDDSRSIRMMIRSYLSKSSNLEVIEAEDGAAALLLASNLKPSLIFTDWNMPNMDGITFVRQYRATGAKTPIIMVTTEAEKPRVIEALQAGVNNYLVKPFKREEFFNRVSATCKTFNIPQILNLGNDQAA